MNLKWGKRIQESSLKVVGIGVGIVCHKDPGIAIIKLMYNLGSLHFNIRIWGVRVGGKRDQKFLGT